MEDIYAWGVEYDAKCGYIFATVEDKQSLLRTYELVKTTIKIKFEWKSLPIINATFPIN